MKDKLRGAARAVGFALAMVALAAGVFWILSQFAADDTELQRQAAEIAALEAGMEEANARLEAEGEQPVPVPSVEPGVATPAVPVAPTQAQILSAFEIWCDLESCHGSDGEDGEDAPPMTRQQIFAGFSEWCSTDPRCVGQPGADGIDGADSTTPGPPGRPPTPEEVLDAVEVVCADNACDGPPGPQGVHGIQGAQGIQGEQGTAKPGDYTCPDGEVMTGFTVAQDGAVTLACKDTTPPVIETP